MSVAASRSPAQAPREAVLASAGSGKTFKISSRIIGLLAHGEPVDSVLASTFTRKAAGQILEAVLERLAKASLNEKDAAELARFAELSRDHPLPADPAFWRDQLQDLVRALHRTSFGTLDSFFMGIARAFIHELGLPPGWGIADGPTMERLRSEALQEVLASSESEEIVELLLHLNRQEVRRSVHDHLLTKLGYLLIVYDSLDPRVDDPWSVFRMMGDGAPPSDEELDQVAARFEAVPVPRTKEGKPRQHWQNSLTALPGIVRERNWDAFVKNGLCKKIVANDLSYDRAPISDEVCELHRDICELAARDLRPKYADQVEALGRLTTRFARACRERQAREGAYEFGDVTRVLADGEAPMAGREDLHYRLDARVRHFLLDEFQDTSLAQWEAIKPIVEEVLSDPGNRAGVVVADPKQSIYGWRGGEPAIVHHVKDHFGLAEERLDVSWRSSPVVLDFVNRVFQNVSDLPVMSSDETWQRTAAAWQRDFDEHRAAPPNESMPGFVEVCVGPGEGGRGQKAEPPLCRFAARRVEELYRRMPTATIAVLTRGNTTVARMIYELRRLGVPASEEGGTALTDSAACEAVLALLHLADHPGDTVARYHVALSPLGEAMKFTDPMDAEAAAKLSQRIRADLAVRGYGRMIDRFVDTLCSSCDARELRRLSQMAELGHRFDERGAVRPAEFVRFVESERVEDPSTARVRVMTVHQSKGLQFDVVVLPELEGGLARTSRDTVLAYRPDPVSRTTAVFPNVPSAIRPLFPEIEVAHGQACGSRLRDDLSTLYVALTRAKYSLHVILRGDAESGPGEAKTASRIIREALATAPGSLVAIGQGEILYEQGDPDWHLALDRSGASNGEPRARPEVDAERIRLSQPAARRRLLPRRSPSSLEGGDAVAVRDVLRLDNRRAMERGSIVHAWCETIGWIEDGLPGDDELAAIAHRLTPDLHGDELSALLAEFRRSLAAADVRRALSRDAYPDGAVVQREVPFIHRENGLLVEGVIDRLVVIRVSGRPVRAEIIDFKTDALEADDASLQERIAFYRPQMRAYWRAVQALYRLPPEKVSVKLVFMQRGVVVGMGVGEG